MHDSNVCNGIPLLRQAEDRLHGNDMKGTRVGTIFLLAGGCILYQGGPDSFAIGAPSGAGGRKETASAPDELQHAANMSNRIHVIGSACCFATRIAQLSGPPVLLPLAPGGPLFPRDPRGFFFSCNLAIIRVLGVPMFFRFWLRLCRATGPVSRAIYSRKLI